MSNSSSLTWAAHVRILFQLYQLPDPLVLLNNQLWPKNRYKLHIKTSVCAFHESVWRSKAANNSKLTYLNTQATGLSGRPHPVLTGILTTQDVVFSRVHVKILAGDYLCNYYLDKDRGLGGQCRLCPVWSPDSHCRMSPHVPASDPECCNNFIMCSASQGGHNQRQAA